MYTSASLVVLATIASASIIPTLSIDLTLIPEFGLMAGQDPNGSGSCTSADNILIPCSCTPERQEFIEKVSLAVASGNVLGTPITFNVDPLAQSDRDIFNRATTCLVVLQSFNGTRGVGCPAVSAPNILNQQKEFAHILE